MGYPLGLTPPLCTPAYLTLFFPLAQSLQTSQPVRAWTFLYLAAAIIQIGCFFI